MTFLNLFPHDMQPGDVWAEGQQIVALEQIPHLDAWRIHLDRGHCIMEWPANAPRRILRPGGPTPT